MFRDKLKKKKSEDFKNVAIGIFYIWLLLSMVITSAIFLNIDWDTQISDLSDTIEKATELAHCQVNIGDEIYYEGICTQEIQAAVAKKIEK